MKKLILLSCIVIIALFLGGSRRIALAPEGEDVVKQWWQSLQTNGIDGAVWTPVNLDEFKITGLMQGKVDQKSGLGYDEVWCGNFSPALTISVNATSNSNDSVIKNFCVVRKGNTWEMASYPNSKGLGPFEEDFLYFGCTNWAKENDISDIVVTGGSDNLDSDKGSCDYCS